MSDPRYTDPRYTDPRIPPQNDPAAMRRLNLKSERDSGALWGWATAIFALVVIMALVIGYNRSDNVATTAPNTPTTTGSAPATPRPPPVSNPEAPSLTLPPASAPAQTPAPAPAPAPAPEPR